MKKIFFFCIAFSLFTFHFCTGQNLFDLQHTKSFADYLYESGQYKLAAEESERWLFLSPGNDTASLMLLQSCRKGGLYDLGIQKSKTLFDSGKKLNAPQSLEYATMLMLNKNFIEVDTFLKSNNSLSVSEHNYLMMNKFLMMKDWKKAEHVFHNNEGAYYPGFKPYADIFKAYKDLPHRSAALAMTMSTIVPGTGKFYTGDWKDAIFSIMLIGASGIQAYRGFNEKGVKSAYGWIFGGFGAGLYLGNIYGSFKSAKDFNHKHENELLKKATDLFSYNL